MAQIRKRSVYLVNLTRGKHYQCGRMISIAHTGRSLSRGLGNKIDTYVDVCVVHFQIHLEQSSFKALDYQSVL